MKELQASTLKLENNEAASTLKLENKEADAPTTKELQLTPPIIGDDT